MSSHYEIRGSGDNVRLEVKGFSVENGKTANDPLVCVDCGTRYFRGEILSKTGDDTKCEECEGELVAPYESDDKDDKKES
jgi:hypothetical protein